MMAGLALGACVAAMILALMAMMGAFLSRDGAGTDTLNLLLAWWTPAALLLAISLTYRLAHYGTTLTERLWARMPAWLYVVLCGLVIVAALAELAVLLVAHLTNAGTELLARAPIVALVASCICLAPAWVGVFGEDRPRRHDAPQA